MWRMDANLREESPGEGPERSRRDPTMWICIGLVVLTLATFWPVLRCDFVNYDDHMYVTEVAQVRQGLTLESIRWAFSSVTGYYIPLDTISHMADCQFFGLNPSGHHATSLLFHTFNAVLLFLVFKRMTRLVWPSAVAAALFAVHPIHVEPVVWISSRKDVLSMFFGLLTMLSYAWYAEKPGIKRYLPVLVLFTCSLLSKPMMMTLPFLLLLVDWWPLDRFRMADKKSHRAAVLLLEKFPLFLLTAACVALAFVTQEDIGALGSPEKYPVGVRLANSAVAHVRYLAKFLWPTDLIPFYPHPGDTLRLWQAIGAAVLLVVATAAVWMTRHRRPYLSVGWLWFLGVLFPVSGAVVQIGDHAMADRYAYLPFIGLHILVAWSLWELCRKTKLARTGITLATAFVVLALAGTAWQQVGVWRNSLTLWQHTLRVTPDNGMAHGIVGEALIKVGRFEEAVPHIEEALRLKPNLRHAHNNLGMAHAELGQWDKAVALYQAELQLEPGHFRALTNLGNAMVVRRDVAKALEYFRQALSIEPAYPNARLGIGAALLMAGDPKGAEAHLREVVRLDPQSDAAHLNLAVALYEQGDAPGARTECLEALRLNPSSDKARAFLELLDGSNAQGVRK